MSNNASAANKVINTIQNNNSSSVYASVVQARQSIIGKQQNNVELPEILFSDNRPVAGVI